MRDCVWIEISSRIGIGTNQSPKFFEKENSSSCDEYRSSTIDIGRTKESLKKKLVRTFDNHVTVTATDPSSSSSSKGNWINRLGVLLKQILTHLNVLVLQILQVVIKEAELWIYHEFHNIYHNLLLYVYRRMMIIYPQPLV